MIKKTELKYVYRFLCAVVLTAIAAGMFYLNWKSFITENNTTGRLLGTGNLTMAVSIYTLLFVIIGTWLKAFKIGVERMASNLAAIVLTCVTSDAVEVLISSAIIGMFRFFLTFIWHYFFLMLTQSVVLSVILYGLITGYRRLFPPFQVLEVYGEHPHGIQSKMNQIKTKYHVAELVPYQIDEEVLRQKIIQYDAVVINDMPSHDKNRILKICLDMGRRVYFLPKISDVIVRSSEALNLMDTPLFLSRNVGIGKIEGAIKRFFDVFLSGLAMVVLSPVFLITAIAIKREDGGPVFFRQERCTEGERRFMILKFRSMIVDAEKDGRPHPAGEADPRITKVGRVIRATRIDELPQLINILKGDMSIVGPRPERVEHVEKYTKEIPEFKFRSKVKGGLTGYAQVYGKYNTEALDKLKLDLMYIMNYSLLLDLQIIFETLKIILRKESTEGFTAEKAQEMHDSK